MSRPPGLMQQLRMNKVHERPGIDSSPFPRMQPSGLASRMPLCDFGPATFHLRASVSPSVRGLYAPLLPGHIKPN